MKIIVADNYLHLSEIASGIIAKVVLEKPNAVLGLATGSSPVGTYKKLIDYYNNGLISFSEVN
ncbi:MAG: glucosamine-6-phosphate deaminase, partial [Clostridia bacterium]|nr:glucosamine-6-phosphate deaminase [Clostridia bacterium]